MSVLKLVWDEHVDSVRTRPVPLNVYQRPSDWVSVFLLHPIAMLLLALSVLPKVVEDNSNDEAIEQESLIVASSIVKR